MRSNIRELRMPVLALVCRAFPGIVLGRLLPNPRIKSTRQALRCVGTLRARMLGVWRFKIMSRMRFYLTLGHFPAFLGLLKRP